MCRECDDFRGGRGCGASYNIQSGIQCDGEDLMEEGWTQKGTKARLPSLRTEDGIGATSYGFGWNVPCLHGLRSTPGVRQTKKRKTQRTSSGSCANGAAGWGYPVEREYVELENGGKGLEYRKQFGAIFAGAVRREFDLLLVWSLDRFNREGIAATVGHLQRLASYDTNQA